MTRQTTSSENRAPNKTAMAAFLFRLFSATFLGVTAFQSSIPCAPASHRNRAIIWKYVKGTADESTTQHNIASTGDADPITTKFNLSPEDVVVSCMDALLINDVPWLNHGLEVCFDFSSDKCRAALGGSLDDFISFASNPTFGPMKNAKEYEIVNVGPIIAGTPTRGSMQTVLVKVTPAEWREKHFLW
jgi:hypothetical protein